MTSRYGDTDPDLSTLTNIRLNNRKAKQRLVKEAFSDAEGRSRIVRDDFTTDTVDNLRYAFNDESTLSPVRPRRRSPLRHSVTRLNSGSESNGVKRGTLMGAREKRDMDRSILDDDNLRYLDENSYQADSRRNKEKRDRFLRDILSSPVSSLLKENQYDSKSRGPQVREARPSHVSLTPIKTKKPGFRPRDIPDLQPTSYRNVDLNPLDFKPKRELISPGRSHLTTQRPSEGDYKPHPLNTRYDDDFESLIKKYNLKNETEYTLDTTKTMNKYELQQLRAQVKDMEEQLEIYHRHLASSKALSHEQEEIYKRNVALAREVKKLNQFIKFMDSNFSEIYSKWIEDKQEKERLQRLVDNMKTLSFNSPTKSQETVTTKPLATRKNDFENTEQLLKLSLK